VLGEGPGGPVRTGGNHFNCPEIPESWSFGGLLRPVDQQAEGIFEERLCRVS
jgi:hypothetical protein